MSNHTSATSASTQDQKNNFPSTTKTNSNNQKSNTPLAKANSNNQKSVPSQAIYLYSVPSQAGRKSTQNTPIKSSEATSPKKGKTGGKETPIEFQFDFDKSTKEQILAALEKSQQEEDDQPLISAQHSQSETNYDVKKLSESPIVKAFNEAERRRLSKSNK